MQRLKEVNLLDACHMICDSWLEMRNSVIIKSWKPLLEGMSAYDDIEIRAVDDNQPNLSFSQVQVLLNKMGVTITTERLKDWFDKIDLDDYVTEQDIIQMLDEVEEQIIEIVEEIVEEAAAESAINDFDENTAVFSNPETQCEMAESYARTEDAFCTLIEYYKKQDDAQKLLLLKDWRNSFVDQATLN